MSFIVQILPFVHLFTLKIVFRETLNPPPGLCPGPAGGLDWTPNLSPQVVPTFHFILSYAPDIEHICGAIISDHYTNEQTFEQ